MKKRGILFLMVATVFLFATRSSFACTEPPIQPSRALGLTTWPAFAGVGVVPNNVPTGPVTTAITNWNIQLGFNGTTLCTPVFAIQAGSFYSVAMSFNSLPNATPCPTGSTCPTRGLTTFTSWDANGRLKTVTTQINSSITSTAAQTEVIAHEFGHTMGLLDCNPPACASGSSVMASNEKLDVNGNPVTGVNSIVGQPGPTICDFDAVLTAAPDYVCQPPPPPAPPDCGCCSGPVGAKLLDTPLKKDVKVPKGKQQTSCYYDCSCCQPACSLQSPIIIDVAGAGFYLTNAANGVRFDIRGTGAPVQIAWTAPGAQNAFLCLPDPNGNCDDGKDLFGNFTPQPASSTPNGFAALAVYDTPANGGNSDGVIDSRDAIFSRLRLWIDANHDGISQPSELFTLPSLGVNSISLDYKWDGRTDQYGNIFRYRAQVNPGGAPGMGRMTYDVFLTTIQSAGTTTTAKSCTGVRPSVLDQGKDARTGKLK